MLGLQFYYKETPTQVFSCEFFNNTCFEEHLGTTVSIQTLHVNYKASFSNH